MLLFLTFRAQPPTFVWKRLIAPPGFVAPAHPLRTSSFLFPSVLLCTFSSHRLLLAIFQLVAADLYLNPNICPIQCESCIQPNAWLCLCPFEHTEWATWLGNADIAWSLGVFVRIDQMKQGREEKKGFVFSLPSSAATVKEMKLRPFQGIIINRLPVLQNRPLVWYESNGPAIKGDGRREGSQFYLLFRKIMPCKMKMVFFKWRLAFLFTY